MKIKRFENFTINISETVSDLKDILTYIDDNRLDYKDLKYSFYDLSITYKIEVINNEIRIIFTPKSEAFINPNIDFLYKKNYKIIIEVYKRIEKYTESVNLKSQIGLNIQDGDHNQYKNKEIFYDLDFFEDLLEVAWFNFILIKISGF